MGEGPIQAWLARTARELALWIVAGTIPIKAEGGARVSAACLVIDTQGSCVARYDKIHLFDVDVPAGAQNAAESYRESATIAPGQQPAVVDTPLGRVGLAVCYDLRFPELFRRLAAQGAEILCLPAAFTVPTGRAHWEVLLRARGVENLCYVLAPAQVGRHANGRDTYGHSMIVGPWGEILNVCADEPGIATAAIDLQRLAELRQRFPVLAQRRLAI
jgi:deaminated glutathione amidase